MAQWGRFSRRETSMKKIVLLAVVVVAGLLAFNYFTTGELRLLPASSSPEAKELTRLEGDLRRTMIDYRTAAKGAALSGVDFTTEVTAARRNALEIQKELGALRDSLPPGRERDRADRLMEQVKEFLASLE